MKYKLEVLMELEKLIDYKFKDVKLLIDALTTPQLGVELKIPDYEFLETLGDAVLKVIFILLLHEKGINTPERLTKIKSLLESDKALIKLATKIKLESYIFKAKNQEIRNTKILADCFEAICGAIYFDSNKNLNLVRSKLIDPFYTDIDNIIQTPQYSRIGGKNLLLEFLQKKYRTELYIELEYKVFGKIHNPIWRAENPKILERMTGKELIKIPIELRSSRFETKKEAERDIYLKILNHFKRCKV